MIPHRGSRARVVVRGHNGDVPRSLRVLSFNVRQLRDDRAAVVEVLRTADADVVALQEPPRGPFGRGRLRAVAREAGYEPAVSGAGARTTAILVRTGTPVTGARGVRLPWRPGRTRRGLAVADVAGVRVVSVHLSLFPAERAAHLIRLLLMVRATEGPCVVAGDLNEEPGGPTWRRLASVLRDATAAVGPTFTARRPRRRLDAIHVSPGVTTSGARALRGDVAVRASDHCGVVVDLTW